MILAGALLFAVVVALILWLWVRENRIEKSEFSPQTSDIREAPVEITPPPEHVAVLEHRFPIYQRLTSQQKRRLHALICCYIEDKTFVPCNGLETVTNEMKVLIGAHAALLALNRPIWMYPTLHTIRVYPHAFDSTDHQGKVHKMIGESEEAGTVSLAWDWTKHGAEHAGDGKNPALHEFTHQLDQESGDTDGMPLLASAGISEATWMLAFMLTFQQVVDQIDAEKESLFNDYGLSHPAELFAAGAERFFEKPRELRDEHAALYRNLSQFFGFDPAEEWFD
ncbi:MAG: zinc-dependent peptidase [Verrucomicrobiota bacterium]